MIERKCFSCGKFGHIACNYRNIQNRREERLTLMFSKKFEVLKNRVINIGEDSGKKIRKDRKIILRKEIEERENSRNMKNRSKEKQ